MFCISFVVVACARALSGSTAVSRRRPWTWARPFSLLSHHAPPTDRARILTEHYSPSPSRSTTSSSRASTPARRRRSRSSSGAPPSAACQPVERDRRHDLRSGDPTDIGDVLLQYHRTPKELHEFPATTFFTTPSCRRPRATTSGCTSPACRATRTPRCIIVRQAYAAPRGRQRQALPGRAGRAVRGQHRLRLRRGGRGSHGRAAPRAAVLHELELRAPARDRAGGGGRDVGLGT